VDLEREEQAEQQRQEQAKRQMGAAFFFVPLTEKEDHAGGDVNEANTEPQPPTASTESCTASPNVEASASGGRPDSPVKLETEETPITFWWE
jgi:hypothetical protein